jgi:hypothetical protein
VPLLQKIFQRLFGGLLTRWTPSTLKLSAPSDVSVFRPLGGMMIKYVNIEIVIGLYVNHRDAEWLRTTDVLIS